MNFDGKTVLVVGGSGVFGSLLVSELAARGARVLATCTGAGSAQRIPDAAALKLVLNLEDANSIEVLANYLAAEAASGSLLLDGVILAAGVVGFGTADATPADGAARLMQVNYLGQANLVSRLLPVLKLKPESFLAAITGVVAEKTFPGMGAYSASKSALSVWLNSARVELRRAGVKVTEARPGHTETGLATRAIFGTAPQMPQGMEPAHVVQVLLAGISEGTPLLESSAF